MSKKSKLEFFIALTVVILVAMIFLQQEKNKPAQLYSVYFKNGNLSVDEKRDILKKYGEIKNGYNYINFYIVNMREADAKKLRKEKHVMSVKEYREPHGEIIMDVMPM